MTRSATSEQPLPDDVQVLSQHSYEVVCALQSLEQSLRDMSMELCGEEGSSAHAYLDLAWRTVAHIRMTEADPLDVGLNQLKRRTSDLDKTKQENARC